MYETYVYLCIVMINYVLAYVCVHVHVFIHYRIYWYLSYSRGNGPEMVREARSPEEWHPPALPRRHCYVDVRWLSHALAPETAVQSSVIWDQNGSNIFKHGQMLVTFEDQNDLE